MLTTVSIRDAVLDSAKEVFETMVFMALEDAGEDGAVTDEAAVLGSITFKGDLEGCLGVCCSPTCARTIAANMLGMDNSESLGENETNDAIGEIANMVMGAVKSRIQQDAGAIEVSIPTVVQGRELRTNLGDKANRVTVRANIEEEYTAVFSLLYRETTRRE